MWFHWFMKMEEKTNTGTRIWRTTLYHPGIRWLSTIIKSMWMRLIRWTTGSFKQMTPSRFLKWSIWTWILYPTKWKPIFQPSRPRNISWEFREPIKLTETMKLPIMYYRMLMWMTSPFLAWLNLLFSINWKCKQGCDTIIGIFQLKLSKTKKRYTTVMEMRVHRLELLMTFQRTYCWELIWHQRIGRPTLPNWLRMAYMVWGTSREMPVWNLSAATRPTSAFINTLPVSCSMCPGLAITLTSIFF